MKKKKQIKHFVPNIKRDMGTPACQCYNFGEHRNLPAFADDGEIAKTKRKVTCKNCRNTIAFRGRK